MNEINIKMIIDFGGINESRISPFISLLLGTIVFLIYQKQIMILISLNLLEIKYTKRTIDKIFAQIKPLAPVPINTIHIMIKNLILNKAD